MYRVEPNGVSAAKQQVRDWASAKARKGPEKKKPRQRRLYHCLERAMAQLAGKRRI